METVWSYLTWSSPQQFETTKEEEPPLVNKDEGFDSKAITDDYAPENGETAAFNLELELTQRIKETAIPSSIEDDTDHFSSRFLNKKLPLAEAKFKMGKGISTILKGEKVISTQPPQSNGLTTTFVANLESGKNKIITVLQLDQITSSTELFNHALTTTPSESSSEFIHEARHCSDFIFLQNGLMTVENKEDVERYMLSQEGHVFFPILTAKNG